MKLAFALWLLLILVFSAGLAALCLLDRTTYVITYA